MKKLIFLTLLLGFVNLFSKEGSVEVTNKSQRPVSVTIIASNNDECNNGTLQIDAGKSGTVSSPHKSHENPFESHSANCDADYSIELNILSEDGSTTEGTLKFDKAHKLYVYDSKDNNYIHACINCKKSNEVEQAFDLTTKAVTQGKSTN